jgi:hypothetical protein
MVIARLVSGDRRTIAGTVYGTIVILSILAAGAKAYEHQLWRLAAILAVSAVVLWLAHVYAHGLGESLKLGRRLTGREFATIVRREYSIVLAAVLPVTAVALGALNVVQDRTAVAVAFAVGVLTLAAQGLRYAQLEHLSRRGRVLAVAVNLAFGLALVAAEAFLAH